MVIVDVVNYVPLGGFAAQSGWLSLKVSGRLRLLCCTAFIAWTEPCELS